MQGNFHADTQLDSELNIQLNELFARYKDLSEDDLYLLIEKICASEKQRLGIPYKVNISIEPELDEVGGDCRVELNPNTGKNEAFINMSYAQTIGLYLKRDKKPNPYLDTSLDTLCQMVEIVCHEIRHTYQTLRALENDNVDGQSLTWLEDYIVRHEISNETYIRNHASLPREDDALRYQFDAARGYFERHCPQCISSLPPKHLKYWEDSFLHKKKNRLSDPDKIIKDEDGQEMSLSAFMDKYMTMYMSRLSQRDLVQVTTQTALGYKYNSDGSKKNYLQLMEDKQGFVSNLDKKEMSYLDSVRRLDGLYSTVISNDPLLQQQESYYTAEGEYKSSIQSITWLIAKRSQYSDIEYNERMRRLKLARDLAKKKMDKYSTAIPSQTGMDNEEITAQSPLNS